MRAESCSWWFLLGAICLPFALTVLLLNCYQWMKLDIDLRVWIWSTLAVSVVAGVICIWRLPLHWILRLDLTVFYIPLMGYSLIAAAGRFAASLS